MTTRRPATPTAAAAAVGTQGIALSPTVCAVSPAIAAAADGATAPSPRATAAAATATATTGVAAIGLGIIADLPSLGQRAGAVGDDRSDVGGGADCPVDLCDGDRRAEPPKPGTTSGSKRKHDGEQQQQVRTYVRACGCADGHLWRSCAWIYAAPPDPRIT